MEEYINKTKQLYNKLLTQGMEFLMQFKIAWVLHNLGEQYEAVRALITQSLRRQENIENYKLDDLFTHLLDESRRIATQDDSTATLLVKKYKTSKKKFCNNCKKTGHEAENCWFLHPEKAPDFQKPPTGIKRKYPEPKPQINLARKEQDD